MIGTNDEEGIRTAISINDLHLNNLVFCSPFLYRKSYNVKKKGVYF